MRKGAIDAFERPGCQPLGNICDFHGAERQHVGIAPHEGNIVGARCHLHDVAGEQHALAIIACPMQHRTAGEMPATADKRYDGG
ncbi:hypothetical protein D3C87_2030660 [compost metagenome]